MAPGTLHDAMNDPEALRARVQALHARAPVADGHADSLMWNRDLLTASEAGHVDFPRLREAGVKLQSFTIVTRGLPLLDGFSLFAWKQGWPAHARRSEWARCTWQLDRMAHFCRASQGTVSIAGTSQQLTDNLAQGRLSAVLGIEGAHALEGQVERVAELHARGVRFMSLTHLDSNELGGTSTPWRDHGPLTPLGHQVLDAMASARMAVDLAHASPAMVTELLAHPTIRPFCSHAGMQGAHPLWRNLPDAVLRGIADKGGTVGVIFAPQFVGGKALADVARHIEHGLQVMGEDGVALGSDYDGMVPLPQGMRDVRDLPKLTEVLLRRGLAERVVEKVIGGNARRFFGEVL